MKVSTKHLFGKKLDDLIAQTYNAKCSGVQIPIMEIPKIYKVARQAYHGALMFDAATAQCVMVASMLSYVDAIRCN